MLARTFRQMLVILEKNVRDSRAIWQALWQGFRMPPFARGRPDPPGAALQEPPDLTRALRFVARADLELRLAAGQTPGAGAARLRPGRGAQTWACAVGFGAVVVRGVAGTAGRTPKG